MKLGSAQVSFNHLRDARVTTCTIVSKGRVFQGTAKCSLEDHFSRHIGRKVSMTKAISKCELSKTQRRNVWNAYRDMTQKPRW